MNSAPHASVRHFWEADEQEENHGGGTADERGRQGLSVYDIKASGEEAATDQRGERSPDAESFLRSHPRLIGGIEGSP
jgi:hypothetical protein